MEDHISAEDFGEVMTIVLIEVLAALSPDDSVASERLETIASGLLDAVNGLIEGTPRKALRSLAHTLIKTEGGAGPVYDG